MADPKDLENEELDSGAVEGGEATTKEVAEPDYLNMSDDELLNAPMPEVPTAALPDKKLASTEDDDKDVDPENPDGDPKAAEPAKAKPAAGDGTVKDKKDDKNGKDDKSGTESKTPEEKAESTEKKDDTPEEKTEEVDYKTFYDRIMAPFKANGREIQAKSVDDAIDLMQMGANYNKKMAALKPNLKLLRMLENNQLLSEEKINFLIDLSLKKPEAISQLIKDGGLDHMDLTPEKASGYKRSSYAVDDKEVELDQVLGDLKDSPKYVDLLQTVSNKWDAESKRKILEVPVVLKALHDHMEAGIFDIVTAELERERTFGRLSGLSDLEAYEQVGNAINARGGFNHLSKATAKDTGKPAAKQEVILPKSQKAEDPKLKEQRRAASPAKTGAPASTTPPDFNPLGLSDADFDKLSQPKFA